MMVSELGNDCMKDRRVSYSKDMKRGTHFICRAASCTEFCALVPYIRLRVICAIVTFMLRNILGLYPSPPRKRNHKP